MVKIEFLEAHSYTIDTPRTLTWNLKIDHLDKDLFNLKSFILGSSHYMINKLFFFGVGLGEHTVG